MDRNLKLGLLTDDGDILLMTYFNSCKSAFFLPVSRCSTKMFIKFIWIDLNAFTIWAENFMNNFPNFTRFFTR